jgi:hypothetical protein
VTGPFVKPRRRLTTFKRSWMLLLKVSKRQRQN